jgi:hypothetical protein
MDPNIELIIVTVLGIVLGYVVKHFTSYSIAKRDFKDFTDLVDAVNAAIADDAVSEAEFEDIWGHFKVFVKDVFNYEIQAKPRNNYF